MKPPALPRDVLAYRLPLLLLAVLALLAALWGGLLRMGWAWPVLRPTLPVGHGPLMVCGFFGTLIALERAVALGKPWVYLGPLFSGLGGVLLLLGVPGVVGPLLLALGSLWLVLVFAGILRKHRSLDISVIALGALCWLAGSLLWLFGLPVYQVVMCWAGFLVLTIAGERLELGRLLRPSRQVLALFGLAVAVYLAGMVIMLFALGLGGRIAGAGMLGLGLWLARFDIARRTVRKSGLTRYIAVCLLSGYAWLAVGGLLALYYGGQPAGGIYDAQLHAVFVGFVFSMVFGHAPIIFPAVLNLQIAYRPLFYLPLALLHASLALRLWGDLAPALPARQWGGLLGAVAILSFLFLVSPLGSRLLATEGRR